MAKQEIIAPRVTYQSMWHAAEREVTRLEVWQALGTPLAAWQLDSLLQFRAMCALIQRITADRVIMDRLKPTRAPGDD